MKKFKKILLILIGLFPLILSAEIKEEVKWKWYTFIEEEIHYENDVEQFCEYFETVDKENYYFGNWNSSINKPEEKPDREIKEIFDTLKFSRSTTNIIMITEFDHNNINSLIYEIILLDENNNKIDYKFEDMSFPNGSISLLHDNDLTTGIELNSYTTLNLLLYEPLDIRDLTIKIIYKEENKEFKGLSYRAYLNKEYMTNAFDVNNTNKQKKCENNVCEIDIRVNKEDFYNEEITIKTRVYSYRDKYYKCYQSKKLYIPGYHKELEGFIKDETDFIKETININDKIENSNLNLVLNNTEESINADIQNEPNNEEENLKEENTLQNTKKDNIKDDMIAIVTKENKENNKNTLSLIFLSISLIFLLIISIIITKNVIKSRTK